MRQNSRVRYTGLMSGLPQYETAVGKTSSIDIIFSPSRHEVICLDGSVGSQWSNFFRSLEKIQKFGGDQLDACTYCPNCLKTKNQWLS